jgi:phenylalanyl-tRNA synthetase alpha chain
MAEDILKRELPEEIAGDPEAFRMALKAFREITATESEEALQGVRVALLGRKGEITTLLQKVRELPLEERPRAGRIGNTLKRLAEKWLEAKGTELERGVLERTLRSESFDITLPARYLPRGRSHLITRTMEEIEDVFIGLGYEIVEGPEVELDYYNFEALNTPEDHPSKSLQDTFYVESEAGGRGEVLLRTHTSPVQVRVMESRKPPLFVISPGRTYRRDVPDATHSPMFHQVEGFAVDKGITFGDLKGTLEFFARAIFGEERDVRFRPHFFPFTEPSAEVDVSCIICEGKGCRICKYSGWLEILGSGMIDPNVFAYVGYDPERYSGFAFGMGVERIALLKHGIPDIRMFFENDLRFLSQF